MTTQPTEGDIVRAEFARIRKRFEGCDLASIRTDSVRKIEAYVTHLEERVAAMPPEPPAFDVVGQVSRSEARGDVRREFARQIERSVL